MTVLVTGATGFVGINLINKLSEDGYDVIALDLSAKNEKINNVQWNHCDVTNEKELVSFLNQDIEMVYHLAGVVGVKKYLENPLGVIDVNFESTRYIAENAKKFDYGILYASTSEIYGKNPLIPWSEDDDRVLGSTRKDRWVYSTSKALSEHLLFAESEIYGIRNINVRYFNLYGAYQKPVNVIPNMITSLIMNKTLIIYDQGTQTRCFTYIDDAIEATQKLVNTPSIKSDAFNIGSDRETNISDLAQLIVDMFPDKDLVVEHLDTSKSMGEAYEDIPRRVPNVSKIMKAVNWKAYTKLEPGLDKTIKWYFDNEDWWKPMYPK